MRKNPTYTALLGPTRLLIIEKSATYTIKWSYTIIWQVRVPKINPKRIPRKSKANQRKTNWKLGQCRLF